MIQFTEFQLDNGLQVIVHQDKDAHQAVLNVLYKVGSKDEREEKTGFAHLFEHLMFGGSKNIPSYDEPLQAVGGDNNAFTTPDITNYYLTLPADNIETGFWLESDRMMSLSFNPDVLEVQRNVVIEEFRQRYLNQPYGDVWLKLRPLTYKKHPYKWPTIGKEISHIETATMDDVRDFFGRFYLPNNAVLVVAGNVEPEAIRRLCEKWFGPIPGGDVGEKNQIVEPLQEGQRFLEVESNVPQDSLYLAYHMPGRLHPLYHAVDLLSDVLGNGKSSRLHKRLVKEDKVFSNINAYVTGSIDPGLLVISGKVNPEFDLEGASEKVDSILHDLLDKNLSKEELSKVKAQAESTVVFSEMEVLSRAMNIAYGAALGQPDLINNEVERIRSVSMDDFYEAADMVLQEGNRSKMFYKSA